MWNRRPRPCCPLVTSQCPGVVCFLRKTAPHALPFLSSTKSPMAAAAAVVQDAAVCYVGACADKKLEGYRRDLMDDDVPHISLVLTLTEFVEAIGADRSEATQAVATEADLRDTRVHAQSQAASGGYADFVYQKSISGSEPEWKRGRNNDVVECTLGARRFATFEVRDRDGVPERAARRGGAETDKASVRLRGIARLPRA